MKRYLLPLFLLLNVLIFGQDSGAAVSRFSVQDTGFNISNTMGSPSQRAALAMTTPEYPVTPGDLYQLTFISSFGIQRLSLFVGYDYIISLSNIGDINGNGKTFLTLKDEIHKLLLRTYPLSAPELIIIDTGSFPVIINGEVKTAGEVSAWSIMRLSELISSHITAYASTRNIEILDRNGNKRHYDLFQAQRFGDLTQDPYLHPGDRVFVSRANKRISISGSVYRPGTYQLLPGETIKDLIQTYAEGFLDNADMDRIRIIRAVGGEDVVGERYEISFKDMDGFELSNLDNISVPVIQSFLPVIFFEGAIYQDLEATDISLTASQKVPYSFYPGATLADAVRDMQKHFAQMSNLEGAYVRRKTETISVDLSQYLYDHNFEQEIVLEPNDTIVIPFRQFFVTVSGAVAVPGRYPYVPDRSWRYYVNLAGGIDPLRNSLDVFKVYNLEDEVLKEVDNIPPEAKIEVATNSFLFYFNQYAPVITTVLSIVSTSLSLYFATGGTF